MAEDIKCLVFCWEERKEISQESNGANDGKEEFSKTETAPSQTLKWAESGKNSSRQDVELQGTEPYIVGGHTASGYWVNTNGETTVHGLLEGAMDKRAGDKDSCGGCFGV